MQDEMSFVGKQADLSGHRRANSSQEGREETGEGECPGQSAPTPFIGRKSDLRFPGFRCERSADIRLSPPISTMPNVKMPQETASAPEVGKDPAFLNYRIASLSHRPILSPQQLIEMQRSR